MMAHEITWYHGTSDDSGLDVGDTMDPTCGAFEPCVWLTSSREHAAEFARARAALGGSPVVYRVRLADWAEVAACDGSDPDYDCGADALLCEVGERGASELAILRGGVARVDRID